MSTGSAETERLGELLGRALYESVTRHALEHSARRERGTEKAVQGGTVIEYRSSQRSNVPRATGAPASGRRQGSGACLVVELRSDLGGGKTTFVKGLARGAGSKDTVTSPTFTLNQIYRTKNGIQIAHHDFYRLAEPGIMADELVESLQDDKTITIVEWADIVEDLLPEDRLAVGFKPVPTNTDQRQITFSYPEKMTGLMRQIETRWAKAQP